MNLKSKIYRIEKVIKNKNIIIIAGQNKENIFIQKIYPDFELIHKIIYRHIFLFFILFVYIVYGYII